MSNLAACVWCGQVPALGTTHQQHKTVCPALKTILVSDVPNERLKAWSIVCPQCRAAVRGHDHDSMLAALMHHRKTSVFNHPNQAAAVEERQREVRTRAPRAPRFKQEM